MGSVENNAEIDYLLALRHFYIDNRIIESNKHLV